MGRFTKKDEPLVFNSLDELLALLADERRKTLKKRRFVKIFLGFYLSLFVIMLIGVLTRSLHGLGGIFNSFGSFTGMIVGMYAATQKQKKGVQALAEFDDVRAVPRLIEMLEYNDNDLRNDAAMLLEKLLPRLQASDAPLLAPEHHAILNRLLAGKLGLKRNWTKQFQATAEQLQITTLRALQQVGDASSLPIVMELAEDAHRTTHVDVMAAAKECLPFLQMRVENQRLTQTLLRASDGNHTATDVLLRPAMSTASSTPANQLLRVAPDEIALPPETLAQTPFILQTIPMEEHAESQTAQLHSS